MDWQGIARVVAPTLAAGLLGPMGGIVAKVAAGALFPDDPRARETATPQTVIDRIAGLDPAELGKLRQAEADLRRFEAENKIRLAELEATGVQNARTMRLTALASGNITADRLGWVVLVSFLAVASLVLLGCGLLIAGWVSPQDLQANPQAWVAVSGLIGAIVGYFSANAQQVVGFYFGSSAGSAAKTDQLASATQAALDAAGRMAPAPAAARTETPAADAAPTGRPTPDGPASGAGPAAPAPDPPAAPPVNARWDACIAYVLEREGGLADRPDDPGGITNMGITHRTLAAWRHGDATPDDVRALTPDEAKAIYRANYWNAARCDALSPGVDLTVFDAGVMSGPAQAVRLLQRAAGMAEHDVDGVVGPRTLGAVGRVPPARLIEELARQRLLFYRGIVERRPASGAFLQGWTNRVDMTRERAGSMARMWA